MGIMSYYEKQRLMEQLASELELLKQDEEIKADLQIETDIRKMMGKYGKSAFEISEILTVIEPKLKISSAQPFKKHDSGPKNPRKARVYLNPHTGEEVIAKSLNHKKLIEWRNEYGDEAVQNWVSQEV